MGKEKGYRNLREEIRAYLEFQRAMGVKALGGKSRRPSPPAAEEEAQPPSTPSTPSPSPPLRSR